MSQTLEIAVGKTPYISELFPSATHVATCTCSKPALSRGACPTRATFQRGAATWTCGASGRGTRTGTTCAKAVFSFQTLID
jgi:hypothetical protein